MRRFLLGALLTACGGAPEPAPTVPTEETVVVPRPPPDTRRADADVVPGWVSSEVITDLLAHPSWPHFITVAEGNVTVHDARTGEARATMRPYPRDEVRVHADARGEHLLVEPLSSYAGSTLFWSLVDDRAYVLGERDPEGAPSRFELSPTGEHVLRVRGRDGVFTLALLDPRTEVVLAERAVPHIPSARFSHDGSVIVVAGARSAAPLVIEVLDARTLAPRFALPEADSVAVLRASAGVLLESSRGLELFSTVDGTRKGVRGAPEDVAANPAAPDEAYDGSCLSIPIPETERVRLYDARDLRFVHEVRSVGTHALLPGCEGVVTLLADGTVRAYGPTMREGVAFGGRPEMPDPLGDGPRVRPIAIAAVQTRGAARGNASEHAAAVLASNGASIARIARDGATPDFVRPGGMGVRERSAWDFGFLASGAIFVTGRGHSYTFGRAGYARLPCHGPAAVRHTPDARPALVGSGQLCDLDRGVSHPVLRTPPARAARFPVVLADGSVSRALDLVDGTLTALPPGRAPHTDVAAISENRRTVAYTTERRDELLIVDAVPARRATRRAPIALPHGASQIALYEGMILAESGTHVSLLALDGATRLERAKTPARYVPVTPSRAFFLASDGASTEVIDARTARVLATLDGAPLRARFFARGFEAEPELTLPIVQNGERSALVRADGDSIRTVLLGEGVVLGADPLERFVALCEDGALVVLDADTGTRSRFGRCLDTDRVRVRADGLVVMRLAGVRITLVRETSEVTLHVLFSDRDANDTRTLVTTPDGAFSGSADLAASMRHRTAGHLLRSPLRALDAAQETASILGIFEVSPAGAARTP